MQKSLKRGVFNRILGIPATRFPQDSDCWSYGNGKIEIDLAKAPELGKKGGSIRLEGQGLPVRVLVIHGDDDNYYALKNQCTHMRRRLDPVPGGASFQCCSVNRSTFDYKGNSLAGPGKKSLEMFAVEQESQKVIVSIL